MTTQDIESAALKRSHAQSLEQVIEALNVVPAQLREINSTTMAISLRRLPEAKKLIRQFQRKLCAFLECNDDASEAREEVYNLNVQLVPVSKLPKLKEKQK
jgi:hypothetical protein